MSNEFNVNSSAPESGLGTFSNTVTSSGLYTLQFRSSVPYFPAGSNQSSAAVNEVQDVTCAADTAGNKNSTWWSFNSAGDAYKWYVWYNINSAGVDPAPSGYTAGIEVAGATGATAATLATATIAAINASASASPYVTASAGASGHLILTNDQGGKCTAAANGTASYGASFSITTTGSFGSPEQSGLVAKIYNNSVLQQTYQVLSPSAPYLSGAVSMSVTSGNAVQLVLSSLSGADALPNAVKTVINFFAGQ